MKNSKKDAIKKIENFFDLEIETIEEPPDSTCVKVFKNIMGDPLSDVQGVGGFSRL